MDPLTTAQEPSPRDVQVLEERLVTVLTITQLRDQSSLIPDQTFLVIDPGCKAGVLVAQDGPTDIRSRVVQ